MSTVDNVLGYYDKQTVSAVFLLNGTLLDLQGVSGQVLALNVQILAGVIVT